MFCFLILYVAFPKINHHVCCQHESFIDTNKRKCLMDYTYYEICYVEGCSITSTIIPVDMNVYLDEEWHHQKRVHI